MRNHEPRAKAQLHGKSAPRRNLNPSAQMNSFGRRIIGERSEPHTYRTVGKNLRHIYIYVLYIYIYIYTFVRRARARYAQTSDRPVEVLRSI